MRKSVGGLCIGVGEDAVTGTVTLRSDTVGLVQALSEYLSALWASGAPELTCWSFLFSLIPLLHLWGVVQA